MKTYKGEIIIRERVEVPKEVLDMYPDIQGQHLGYVYRVDFVNHPRFRSLQERLGGRTSLVVAERETPQGREIETLNTIYTVGYTREGYEQ